MTSDCNHEPSVILTAGQNFVESVICQCVRCGELITIRDGRVYPSLRAVPPEQAEPSGSRP